MVAFGPTVAPPALAHLAAANVNGGPRRQRRASSGVDAGPPARSLPAMLQRISIVVGLLLVLAVIGCGGDPVVGPAGARGADGAAGVQGPAGEAGERGEAGKDGPAGAIGAPGAAGVDGAPGAVGPAGKDGKDGAGGPVSDARLKARYRVADGGAREYIPGAWYDSTLAVNCTFQRAADGVDRCLPAMRPVSDGVGAYLDAACTQHALTFNPPQAGCAIDFDLGYASNLDNVCFASLHVLALGPVDPLAVLYFKNGPMCATWSIYPPGSVAAQAILAEVPAATFAGSTLAHD